MPISHSVPTATGCKYLALGLVALTSPVYASDMRWLVLHPPVGLGGLVCHARDGAVELDWPAFKGSGTTVSISRSDKLRGNYAPIATGIDAGEYLDSGLSNGKTYFYIVTPSDGEASRPAIATPHPLPSPPDRVTAACGPDYVTVKWSQVPGACSYKVYCAASKDGPYREFGAAPSEHPGYPNTLLSGVDASSDFYSWRGQQMKKDSFAYYMVTATDADGNESKPSRQASVRLVVLPRPILVAYPGDGCIGLTWDPAINATGYNVYKSRSSTNGFRLLTKSPISSDTLENAETPFWDKGAVNGQRYYYAVTTVTRIGESPLSDPVSAVSAAPHLSSAQAIYFARKFCRDIKLSPAGIPHAVYPVPEKSTRSEDCTIPRWRVTFLLPDGTSGASFEVLDSNGGIAECGVLPEDLLHTDELKKPFSAVQAIALAKTAIADTGNLGEYKNPVFLGTVSGTNDDPLYEVRARRKYRGLFYDDDDISIEILARTGKVECLGLSYHGKDPANLNFRVSAKYALAQANSKAKETDIADYQVGAEYKAIAAPSSDLFPAKPGPPRAVWVVVYKFPDTHSVAGVLYVDALTGMVIGGV